VAVFAFTQIEHLAHFHIFAPVYGFGHAGVMTTVLVTARVLTPASRRAAMMGVILGFAWLGHRSGGFQGGHFFGLSGHYAVSFANAALFVTVRRRAALPA
jgi:hypothetical protein